MARLKAQDQPSWSAYFSIHSHKDCSVLKLLSEDQTNRLTIARVSALIEAVEALAKVSRPAPLILTGNHNFFSAGADLNEILCLSGTEALAFARLGQELMSAVENFPALTTWWGIGSGTRLPISGRCSQCSVWPSWSSLRINYLVGRNAESCTIGVQYAGH